MDDYKFYFEQLDAQAGKGKPPETTPGTPHSGFYRLRRYVTDKSASDQPGPKKRILIHEPIAFWKEDGVMMCSRKIGRAPEHQDEIDELFSQCCRDAVTEESFRAVMDGGAWPDEVAEREPAAKEPKRIGPTETQTALYQRTASEQKPVGTFSQEDMGVERDYEREDELAENERATPGDNSGVAAPATIMAERIADVNQQVADWLKSIGGKVTNDEQADKAANYAALLGELEKEAEAQHRVEKAPWLEGGRTVDASWKPLIEKAAASKGRVKRDYVTPYLVEKQRRIDAEAKAERERIAAERAKVEQEAAAAGVEPPKVEEPPPPEPERAKAGSRGGRATALRTVKVAEITDLAAVAAFLCGLNPPPADLVDACKKAAEKMMKNGITVPGAKLHDEQRAA